MNLFEYQARELLQRGGVDVGHAAVIRNCKFLHYVLPQLADQITGRTDDNTFWSTLGITVSPAFQAMVDTSIDAVFPLVVKAQVKAGGRGKAGGIKVVQNETELRQVVPEIMAMEIKGQPVDCVMLVPAARIVQEYYVSFMYSPADQCYRLMLSLHGGMDIEDLIKLHPADLHQTLISPVHGLDVNDIIEIVVNSQIDEAQSTPMGKLLEKLWNIYIRNDMTLLEINPLALVERDGQMVLQALDAKVILDDSAKFRQAELFTEFSSSSDSHLELDGLANNLNYVKLQGNVGIIGNGAGLVMSTLDAVELAGNQFANVHPANFLDIGGGASAEVMFQAMQLVMQNDDVLTVFVNIFGGLTQCDIVATGLLEALEHLKQLGAVIKPICVRFAGNRAAEGLEILHNFMLQSKKKVTHWSYGIVLEVTENFDIATTIVAQMTDKIVSQTVGRENLQENSAKESSI